MALLAVVSTTEAAVDPTTSPKPAETQPSEVHRHELIQALFQMYPDGDRPYLEQLASDVVELFARNKEPLTSPRANAIFLGIYRRSSGISVPQYAHPLTLELNRRQTLQRIEEALRYMDGDIEHRADVVAQIMQVLEDRRDDLLSSFPDMREEIFAAHEAVLKSSLRTHEDVLLSARKRRVSEECIRKPREQWRRSSTLVRDDGKPDVPGFKAFVASLDSAVSTALGETGCRPKLPDSPELINARVQNSKGVREIMKWENEQFDRRLRETMEKVRAKSPPVKP